MRLSIAALLVLLGTFAASAQTLTRGPYLQNLSTNSVEILWRTDTPTASAVEIRDLSAGRTESYLCTIPTTVHQMRVPNLATDARYSYRVGTGVEGKFLSQAYTFQTFAGPDATTFDFVAYGDHRNFPKDHRAVVDAILERCKQEGYPRFLLDTGDYTGQGEAAQDPWDEQFFGPAAELMKRVCYFPVIGNHESFTRHPRIPFRYLENFSVPTHSSGTEYYYSFYYGDAHFLMLDVYSTDFVRGSKQYAWIEKDLKESKKKWKFAAMHYPVFIHRSEPAVSYGNQDIRTHLVPLFLKYGVTAVFSGDSHFYQRSDSDGIHYICTGGGGAPLYTPGTDAPYVRASKKAHHYTWIGIAGDTMTLRAFDTKNELIDSMTTGPRQPQLPPPPTLNFVRCLPEAAMRAGEVIVIESRDAEGNVTPAPAYREEGGMMSSTVKSAAAGLAGKGSRFSDSEETDAKAIFTPALTKPGTYLISITTANASSVDAPNTLFEVGPKAEITRGRVALNAANTGDKWYDIGLFTLSPGDTFTLIEVEDQPARFYVDAVRFTRYE
jgi:hypothetical protein